MEGTRITRADLEAVLPDVTSTLRLPGLKAAVSIFRDRWGIPHLRAGSQGDLFLAQGFATAQDRLWHLDADRHQALGRWAEWVGARGVARDRLLRAADMGRAAQLDYEVCSDAARAMFDAYAAGVNTFIATTRSLPIEYALLGEKPEPWEPWHCLAVYKIRNSLLGTWEPKLFRTRLARRLGPERLARILRGYPTGHLLTVPPGAAYEGPRLDGRAELEKVLAESAWMDAEGRPGDASEEPGSNAWAVSGEWTASGLPLVAGDSHRGLDTPNVYYQVHLSCPDFSVIGSSVPGVPGALHFCHNEHVAWGMTHGMADTQDLFIEKLRHRDGGLEYEYRGEWLPAGVRREVLQVRGAAPVELTVVTTQHGPVVAGDPTNGWGVALSDPGLIEGTAWPDAALEAMQARTVHELHQAFRHWNDRVNNYAVADTAGNFGYLHEGRIPVRGEANGWRAVPGWTGAHEWRGYIPHDELPKALNPDTGYIVTCNQKVCDHTYPYYHGIHQAPEFRARRIQARLLALPRGEVTVDEMAGIHAERTSIPGQVLA
ncbi:MAG: penicillin acylase family protein, partial [Gemmatimonadota bacterium]